MTDTFTWRAEIASSGSGEFPMRSSNFGDGYTQDSPTGLNNEKQKWNVSVSGYSANVGPVLDFIRAHKGIAFFWKAPLTSAPGYYVCVSYSSSDQGGDFWTITMQFEQRYKP